MNRIMYNKFVVKNNEGQYIKYPTAYAYNVKYTDSLHNAFLWDSKEGAKDMTRFLMENEGHKNLSVVVV